MLNKGLDKVKIIKGKDKLEIKYPVLLLVVVFLFGLIDFKNNQIRAQSFLQTQEDKINEKIKYFQDITKKDLEVLIDSVTQNQSKDQDEYLAVATKNNKKSSSSNLKSSSSLDKKNKTANKTSSYRGSKLGSNQKQSSKTKTSTRYALNELDKSKSSKESQTKNLKPKPKTIKPKTPYEELTYIKMSRTRGLMSDSLSWKNLEKIDTKKLSSKEMAEFLQFKAVLLYKARYYVLASLYASLSIQTAGFNLGGSSTKTSWEILSKVSQGRSIQGVLVDLGSKMIDQNKIPTEKNLPPYFDKSWYYYIGSSYYSKADYSASLKYFSKLSCEDKLYIPASYQSGIIYMIKDDVKNAERSFQNVLNLKSQKYSKLSLDSLNEINNYTKLALARIFYQTKRFKDSIKFYKSIDNQSSVFYKALYEQAWAFFMIGYTNHALGSIYGASSPFFKDIYNPELSILEAIIYYWMCRYDDSKNALADFIEKYSPSADSLNKFVTKTTLTNKMGYEMFENLVGSVDGKYLGVSKDILKTAFLSDSLRLLRYQYSYVLEELGRLKKVGVYGIKSKFKNLEALKEQLQDKIGAAFIKELKELNSKYEEMSKQSQFLYIELLMSERSQLLGKELHSQKFDKTYSKDFFTKKNAQSWKGSEKNEYWWDEVGFYKFNLEPQCHLKEQQSTKK